MRSDSLIKIDIEHLSIETTTKGEVLELYLPTSKTNSDGETKTLPQMPYLCPVIALKDWLDASHLLDDTGSLFRKVDQWGNVSHKSKMDASGKTSKGLHIDSVVKMMRSAFKKAGLPAERYSSHSLRRGLDNWMTENGATLRETMEWVGWTDERSAIRYQDAKDSLPYELATLKKKPVDEAIETLRDLASRAAKSSSINLEQHRQLLTALSLFEQLGAGISPVTLPYDNAE